MALAFWPTNGLGSTGTINGGMGIPQISRSQRGRGHLQKLISESYHGADLAREI